MRMGALPPVERTGTHLEHEVVADEAVDDVATVVRVRPVPARRRRD